METKRGFTLIELIVSMAVFLIVLNIIVAGFVTVIRVKAMVTDMKESQQKLRLAMEVISRHARQAQKIQIAVDNAHLTTAPGSGVRGDSLVMFFSTSDSSNFNALQFYIYQPVGLKRSLYVSDCASLDFQATACTAWNNGTDMLSGMVDLNNSNDGSSSDSGFDNLPGSFPPSINIYLSGQIGTAGAGLYSDALNLSQNVILEGIK